MQHNRAAGAISETDMVKNAIAPLAAAPVRPGIKAEVAFKILAARGRPNVLTLELLPLRVTIC